MVSYCITCRNRLWQLKETLGENLHSLENDSQCVLVDYGSTDGLSKWVWKNFNEPIASGKLIFFEVSNEVSWNLSRAKNLSHRVANGDFLMNLDADNYMLKKDIQLINEAAEQKLPIHQWSGVFGDGSHGRIGLPRNMFFKIGGYDEYMLPMGAQDSDLIRRIEALNIKILRGQGPAQKAVQNRMMDKIQETTHKKQILPKRAYDKMNDINKKLSEARLALDGPIRKDGFMTYTGKLNGQSVKIDGLNQLSKL